MSKKPAGTSEAHAGKARFDKRLAILTLLVAATGAIVVPLYLHHADSQRDRQVSEAQERPSTGQSAGRSWGSCVVLATVGSAPAALPDQAQRSSDDFDLDAFPPGMRVLRWRVLNGEADSVRFDVLQDVRGGFDQVVYADVRDGAETQGTNLGPLYVANPRNAAAPFTVQVSACPE